MSTMKLIAKSASRSWQPIPRGMCIAALGLSLAACTASTGKVFIGGESAQGAVYEASYNLNSSEIVIGPLVSDGHGGSALDLSYQAMTCNADQQCFAALGAYVRPVESDWVVVVSTVPEEGQAKDSSMLQFPHVIHQENSRRLRSFQPREAGMPPSISEAVRTYAPAPSLARLGTGVKLSGVLHLPIRLGLNEIVAQSKGAVLQLPNGLGIAYRVQFDRPTPDQKATADVLTDEPMPLSFIPVASCRRATIDIVDSYDLATVYASFDVVVADPRYVRLIPVNLSIPLVTAGLCQSETAT